MMRVVPYLWDYNLHNCFNHMKLVLSYAPELSLLIQLARFVLYMEVSNCGWGAVLLLHNNDRPHSVLSMVEKLLNLKKSYSTIKLLGLVFSVLSLISTLEVRTLCVK